MNLTLRLTIRFIKLLAIPFAGGGLLLAASLYLYLSPKLPSVETLKTVKLQTPLRVYSQDLKQIGEFGEKRRTPVTFEDIPEQFVQAMLAAEDDAFYRHIGVDFQGLLRAAWELLKTGHIQTGGSTITMQLARNFFLTKEQSFTRKFNEILLALRIEDEISKNEIFTLYANKIYLGNRAYGVEAAALTYYGNQINTLNLAQLAMIAGLPKAPSTYNPIINPKRALRRRNWILRRMRKLSYITTTAYQSAVDAPVTAQYHAPKIDYNAPYVAESARKAALRELGPSAYTDGYVVITTINSKLQRQADEALRKGVFAYDTRHGYRGPEAHIDNAEQWHDTLAKTPVVSKLEPAIVVAVTHNSLSLTTKTGADLELTTENKSLASLRLFLSPSRRSAPIKNLTKVFSPGDLIRISNNQGDPYLSQLPKVQSALVSLEPDTGAIKAIAGGLDFYQSHFNRVTQARRQPGSNFKPFVYTAALEHGMSAATVINDAPVVFDGSSTETTWRPENSSGQFYGPTRIREALYRSRNLVSIRVLRSTGITATLETLSKFGFDKDKLPRNLSLALGSYALTPLQIASGYAALANGGYKIEPYLIETITGHDGELIYSSNTPVVCRDCESTDNGDKLDANQDYTKRQLAGKSATTESHETAAAITETGARGGNTPATRPIAKRIIEPRVAYLIDSILKDVITRGTGYKARALNRTDIAGKTGTTNGPRDAWFSGYNPDLATTVWLGFDDNKLLGKREFGGSAALPIWMDYMSAALAGKEEKFHPQPTGLVSVKIDPENGLRASNRTKNAIFELFRQENVPAESTTYTSTPSHKSEPSSIPEDIF